MGSGVTLARLKSYGGMVCFGKFAHQASAFPYLITGPVYGEVGIMTKNVTIKTAPPKTNVRRGLKTIPSSTPDLANWLGSHTLDQGTPLCVLLNHSRATPRTPRERPHYGSASRVQGKRTCLPIGQHSSHARAQQGEATHPIGPGDSRETIPEVGAVYL